jgi:predicted transcriptional regulator
MQNKDKITFINKESKVNRILEIEDILYKFINKRGRFDWNISFKNEDQEKKFLNICEKIYMRLNAFEPSEDRYTVPLEIVDATVEIEKLIPKEDKISNKNFIIAFIKWSKEFLLKKDVSKSVPKKLIEKVRYIINNGTKSKQYEIREKIYKILDEHWDILKESIESGKSLVGVAKELGLTRKKLENYIKAKHPDWEKTFGYNPIKIKNINKVIENITNYGMNAAAKEVGCSYTGLYDLMYRKYPQIMAEIKSIRSNNKDQQNFN